MVAVLLQKQPQLRLLASGHANAAPRGEDLVCAGISTLLCTLAAQLQDSGEAELRCGFADIRAVRTWKSIAAFSFAETGLRLLAAQYPAHLCIFER